MSALRRRRGGAASLYALKSRHFTNAYKSWQARHCKVVLYQNRGVIVPRIVGPRFYSINWLGLCRIRLNTGDFTARITTYPTTFTNTADRNAATAVATIAETSTGVTSSFTDTTAAASHKPHAIITLTIN